MADVEDGDENAQGGAKIGGVVDVGYDDKVREVADAQGVASDLPGGEVGAARDRAAIEPAEKSGGQRDERNDCERAGDDTSEGVGSLWRARIFANGESLSAKDSRPPDVAALGRSDRRA